MKPYYDEGGITLYVGDCRVLLPSINTSEVGVVVADPPYGETSLVWDRWQDGWVAAVAAAAPMAAPLWCFGSVRMFLEHRDEFTGWRLGQDIVWEKPNGSNFAADRFKRVHEHVLQWYRGRWDALHREVPRERYDGPAKHVPMRRGTGRTHTGAIADSRYLDDGTRLMRSIIKAAPPRDGGHPTQKPLAIVAPLLAYSLASGGCVLDPMAGGGTVLRAAKDMGYRAIGIEVDEKYAEAAVRRLGQEALAL